MNFVYIQLEKDKEEKKEKPEFLKVALRKAQQCWKSWTISLSTRKKSLQIVVRRYSFIIYVVSSSVWSLPLSHSMNNFSWLCKQRVLVEHSTNEFNLISLTVMCQTGVSCDWLGVCVCNVVTLALRRHEGYKYGGEIGYGRLNVVLLPAQNA